MGEPIMMVPVGTAARHAWQVAQGMLGDGVDERVLWEMEHELSQVAVEAKIIMPEWEGRLRGLLERLNTALMDIGMKNAIGAGDEVIRKKSIEAQRYLHKVLMHLKREYGAQFGEEDEE